MSRRWPDKLVVALTGNIATGKSVIMRLAAERGALTIDADKLVHHILNTDATVQRKIEDAFDGEVRHPGGGIDRRKLGAIVFDDPQALTRLEHITHPTVRKLMVTQVDADPARIVMIEAIKLLESGFAADCDVIWVTRCPERTQIQRLTVCRGLDEATAIKRVKAQPPQEKKVAVADVVIDTNGTMIDTEQRFNHAWERLVNNLPITDISKMDSQWRSVSEIQDQTIKKTGTTPLDKLIVRRGKPADIPSILLLIQRATKGAVNMKRSDMLASFGERGYLIGQEGTQISTIAGWSADNQVATIETIFISPLEAAGITGAAVLEEVESTARSLICEVILALPPRYGAKRISKLFLERGYEVTDIESLPKPWQDAIAGHKKENKSILMKVLRSTRLKSD
jgi:dephospho-CoA kinase